MEQTKGLSCQIPESLHARVTAERVAANQSLSEYITGLLTNYYENGGKKDMAQTRTMAFQISEDLFQRIKDYLAHENERQGPESDPEGVRDWADRGRSGAVGAGNSGCRSRRTN